MRFRNIQTQVEEEKGKEKVDEVKSEKQAKNCLKLPNWK